jgi:hypothetical protein
MEGLASKLEAEELNHTGVRLYQRFRPEIRLALASDRVTEHGGTGTVLRQILPKLRCQRKGGGGPGARSGLEHQALGCFFPRRASSWARSRF